MSNGQVKRVGASWLPAFGLDFTLRMDGFAWMFAVLVTGIGFLVVLYARYYMSPADPVPRFFVPARLHGLHARRGALEPDPAGAVLGAHQPVLVPAHRLLAPQRRGTRRRAHGARGHLCGRSALRGRAASRPRRRQLRPRRNPRRGRAYPRAPAVSPGARARALGTLTKSAQFPFHFWLPHAMSAPTPVSAYLHSAAMVKLGVFLMARLWPVLAGTDARCGRPASRGWSRWSSAPISQSQHDLKGLLAYSTISHLGLITVLLGSTARSPRWLRFSTP